jgi:2-furoyl-CoA dehydrogenase large subunit
MPEARRDERSLHGAGRTEVAAPREALWAMLLDPDALLRIVPGAHGVERLSETEYRADVTLGVGPVKGRYRVALSLSDMRAPEAVTLTGKAEGALGFGHGRGWVTLEPAAQGTVIAWRYEAAVGGKVASIAGRLMDGAARLIIGQFFAALARQAAPEGAQSWLVRVLRALGLRR